MDKEKQNEQIPLIKQKSIKFLIKNQRFDDVTQVITEEEKSRLNSICKLMQEMGLNQMQQMEIIKTLIQLKTYNEILINGDLHNEEVRKYAMNLHKEAFKKYQ